MRLFNNTLPIFAAAMAAAAWSTPAMADITVKLPSEAATQINVAHALIDNMVKDLPSEEVTSTDRIIANGGIASITLDPVGPSRYMISTNDSDPIEIFAKPGEDITVTIASTQPLDYTVGGSPLMEGIAAIEALTAPIENEANAMMKGGDPDAARLDALIAQYHSVLRDFINDNPASAAVPYAMLGLDNEDFVVLEPQLSAAAKESILYPFVIKRLPAATAAVEKERAQKALMDGHVDAPSFTLLNTEGKEVKLADFRGKWVVIDFWGSWCMWCIKGFPHLKEAYEQLRPELEVIGVDCGDTEEAWKAAVEKYSLPWVNVYNPKGSTLADQYQVQGFPTKVIVNPEGKIADITTGEDPEFFTRLHQLMGK